MNYNEIIAPYLIDFDKLEVGQTLWSVIHGEVKITRLDLIRQGEAISINKAEECFKRNGKFDNLPDDKYPTLFTSNPFANLKRVEPLEIHLKKENEELREGLEKIFSILHKPFRSTRNEEIEINQIAESIIQKMKQ